jgi:hypothetical protein
VQTPLPPPNNWRLWLHHLSWPSPVLHTARLRVPHKNAVSAPEVATGSALVLRVWRTREKFRSYSVVHRTSGTERHRLRFAKASASRGVGMSFQITILKVLAGHPEGRASLPDLKRAMAILITSGSDWTDRMKRLAARAPDLDIFSQSFVRRDNAGWQITDAGRAFLDFLQTPIQPTSDDRQAPNVTAIPVLPPAAPPITLIGVNRRRPLPRLAGRRRPSAAA